MPTETAELNPHDVVVMRHGRLLIVARPERVFDTGAELSPEDRNLVKGLRKFLGRARAKLGLPPSLGPSGQLIKP